VKVGLLYGRNVFVTGIRRYAECVEEGLRAAGDTAERVEIARREWRIGKRRVGGFVSFWAARFRHAPRGYDVVHALDPALALPGTDVVTIHDLVLEEYPEWYQRDLGSRVDIRINRALGRRVPFLIAVSEATKRAVVERWRVDPERVVVVPHGVDHDTFRPVERRSKHLAEGKRNLVFLGVNNPRKNILYAVKVVEALAREHGVQARLLRLGPDQFPDVAREYRAYAAQAGVELAEPGFLDDEELASILTHADAFLWPPVAEGFGIPVLEAMACGLPVVARDLPINREVCGELAFYHGDAVREGAEALVRCLEARPDPAPLRAHARQFTWERTVRETRAVYERAREARR